MLYFIHSFSLCFVCSHRRRRTVGKCSPHITEWKDLLFYAGQTDFPIIHDGIRGEKSPKWWGYHVAIKKLCEFSLWGDQSLLNSLLQVKVWFFGTLVPSCDHGSGGDGNFQLHHMKMSRVMGDFVAVRT